jgi:hypothetical protein
MRIVAYNPFLHFFVLKFCVLAPVKVVKKLIKFCMQPVQIAELLNLNGDDSLKNVILENFARKRKQ